ncbi:MAG: hypothetical protein ACK5Z5_07325 [Neisseriaceae bacterium]
MNIVLPGLLWQTIGDIDDLYLNAKIDNFNELIKRASIVVHNFNYSDFLYNSIYDTMYSHGEYRHGLAHFLASEYDYTNNTDLCGKHPYFFIMQPTHLRIDRDRLLICEPELLQLDMNEEKVIIDAINKHFAGEIIVYYISDSFWLVGINFKLEKSDTYPLIDIIGKNINDHLPKGTNSILFNKLLNEIQMLLFSLPLNNLRKSDGLLITNSVWMWDIQINLSSIIKVFCENKDGKRNNIYINNKMLFSHAKPQYSLNSDDGLIYSYNPYVYMLDDELTKFINNQNLILIDSLYYPCSYADSSSFINLLELFDKKVAHVLLQQLKKNKLKRIHLFVPQQNNTIEITISRYDKYKFWRNNTFPKLIKEIM